MKKWLTIGLAGTLAVLLSSCFTLSGFVLLDSSLHPGQSTKARFTVRPYTTTSQKNFQFFLVGNDSSGDLSVGKGTWGTNGKYGGPRTMQNEPTLAAELDASGDCTGGGLDFSAVFGSLSWKGYTTVNKVSNKGTVQQTAVVDVVVKARDTSDTGIAPTVMGITGVWTDDGDGVVEDTDSFACTGNATTNLWVS